MYKKIILGISLFSLVVVAFIAISTKSLADSDREQPRGNNSNNGSYNPDNQLSQSACGNKLGKPVVNVTEKVQNDADSGQAGNYWAFDYYTRNIEAWQTATGTPNTYCAIVTYNGYFYTVPGQAGPGSATLTGPLINTSTNQPVNGSMNGGYRATITGTLLSSPTWSKNGNVGTFNYQCDINDNCGPELVSWPDQYFNTGYNFSYAWWGWKYNGGSHGTWINAISGNSGNIL